LPVRYRLFRPDQAIEVALTPGRAAAEELARLDPADADLRAVVIGHQEEAAGQVGSEPDGVRRALPAQLAGLLVQPTEQESGDGRDLVDGEMLPYSVPGKRAG